MIQYLSLLDFGCGLYSIHIGFLVTKERKKFIFALRTIVLDDSVSNSWPHSFWFPSTENIMVLWVMEQLFTSWILVSTEVGKKGLETR